MYMWHVHICTCMYTDVYTKGRRRRKKGGERGGREKGKVKQKGGIGGKEEEENEERRRKRSYADKPYCKRSVQSMHFPHCVLRDRL